MTKIAIIYYSTYGHVATMAEAIKIGAEKVADVEATIFQVPETMPPEVLEKIHAPEKKDHPIATVDMLENYDAFLFGLPTRFGGVATQMKSFFDQTGGLWKTGALVGKPAGFFFSTALQGGGQESTAFSSMPFLVHHGMTFVPLGYREPAVFSNEEVHGGSAWGAGTVASVDGSRHPSELELKVADVQGESFAKVAKKLRN